MYEFRGLERKKKWRSRQVTVFWGEVALVSFFAAEFFSCEFFFLGWKSNDIEDHK